MRRSSLTGWSLMRTAPPWTWRRASPFDAASPAVRTATAGRCRLRARRVDLDGRQGFGERAFLEGLAGRFGRLVGRRRGRAAIAVTSVASTFLASLISDPPSAASRAISSQRQRREELQEAADIGVLGVAPVLPEIVGRQHVGIEPHRARRRLAHLGARGGGEQRRGQRVELRRAHAVAEIDAVDDVAPLVRAAHLQAQP